MTLARGFVVAVRYQGEALQELPCDDMNDAMGLWRELSAERPEYVAMYLRG